MKSTKRYVDFLGILKKAAEVARYLQELSASYKPSSCLLKNATAMAVCAADGLVVILRRIERELAGDNSGPTTVEGELFPPTPEDQAVTRAEIRSIVDGWFCKDYPEDDEPVPMLADSVSLWVHQNTPITRLDVLNTFVRLREDESDIVEAVEYLIDEGKLEVSQQGDWDAHLYPAGRSPLDALEGTAADAPMGDDVEPQKVEEEIIDDMEIF